MSRKLTIFTLTAAALVAVLPSPASAQVDTTSPQLAVDADGGGGTYGFCGRQVLALPGNIRSVVLDEPATVTAREVAPFGFVTKRTQSLPAGTTDFSPPTGTGPGYQLIPRFARFPMVPVRFPVPGLYTITYTAKNAAGLTSSTRLRFALYYRDAGSCKAGPPDGVNFIEVPNGTCFPHWVPGPVNNCGPAGPPPPSLSERPNGS